MVNLRRLLLATTLTLLASLAVAGSVANARERGSGLRRVRLPGRRLRDYLLRYQGRREGDRDAERQLSVPGQGRVVLQLHGGRTARGMQFVNLGLSRPRFTGHFCGERDDHATST